LSSSATQLSESTLFRTRSNHTKAQGGIGSLTGINSRNVAQEFGLGTDMEDTRRIGADGDENGGDEITIQEKMDDKIDPPPAWSEMKTKAGKDRKRLPLACIACRRKKIRCSGEKPACKHCLRSRIPCVYKVTARKAAPRTDYMAMLDKRLKRMEDRVVKLIPKDSPAASIPRAYLKPSFSMPPPKSQNEKKRSSSQAFGTGDDLDQWAKSRQNKVAEQLPTKKIDPDDHKLLTEGAEALPSKELQEHLAEVYFDYVYGQSYPLLHKPSFMRKLAAGAVPPVLILAVCAISARFSTHPQIRSEPAFLRGESWASVARDIALKRYDSPNITILIVYVLLGLHEFGTCQGGRSWMLGGMAQRMAFALQLHKDLDHETWTKDNKDHPHLSNTDREIRRRTMWSCFLMDRFNSSGTDRPMTISEEWINVPLPIKERYFQMELSGPTENIFGNVISQVKEEPSLLLNPKENMGAPAFYIKLVSLWGRIVRYWNLGGRELEAYPIWSTQSEFHKIKESIRKFHAELPESMRYNTENLQDQASQRIANQFLFLHIMYHQLVLFMHRFALPYSGYGRLPRDMPQQFHTESARTALEAANQISTLIKEAMNHNVVAPFAGYCAYYSSTVHIHGVFSKNPRLEAIAKQNLAHNVRYITKMKKYWGMFHFVAENLKDLYRQHADIALKGGPGGGTPGNGKKSIFQYGDWFDRYPHGVSRTDYEDPAAEPTIEPGTDAVLGQKSDLQSVEEFFATLSPPTRAAGQRKGSKKAKSTRGRSNTSQASTATASATARQTSAQPQPPAPHDAPTLLSHSDTFDSSSFPHAFLGAPPDLAYSGAGPGGDLDFAGPLPLQTGMLSQLDRHLVLSSYAGMDPATAQDVAATMAADLDAPDLGGLAAWVNGSVPGGAALFAGQAAFEDASTHWFMPFNLDPPDVVGDDGSSGGFASAYNQFGGDGFGGGGDGMSMDLGGFENEGGGSGQ